MPLDPQSFRHGSKELLSNSRGKVQSRHRRNSRLHEQNNNTIDEIIFHLLFHHYFITSYMSIDLLQLILYLH